MMERNKKTITPKIAHGICAKSLDSPNNEYGIGFFVGRMQSLNETIHDCVKCE